MLKNYGKKENGAVLVHMREELMSPAYDCGLLKEWRTIRNLPGRVRLEVRGLKRNAQLCCALEKALGACPGVREVFPSVVTGRVLIHYDGAKTGVAELLLRIEELEAQAEAVSRAGHALGPAGIGVLQERKQRGIETLEGVSQGTDGRKALDTGIIEETAATAAAASVPGFSSGGLRESQPGGSLPPALLLSVGGLGVLAVKQILLGRSARAKLPGLFYLAALLAILRDYPVLRRQLSGGIQGSQQSRVPRPNQVPIQNQPAGELPHLILSAPSAGSTENIIGLSRSGAQNLCLKQNLSQGIRTQEELHQGGEALWGAAALALALVRENLVVLAGIGLVQYLRWKSEVSIRAVSRGEPQCPPETNRYSERVGKQNLALAAGAWIMSGDPVRGVGVLLAGNPRAATVPAWYAWEQAELVARDKGYVIPDKGSLAQLARVKHIFLADSLLLCRVGREEIVCVAEPENEDEIWHLAASLMRKTQHRWLEKVSAQAKAAKGTIRTAFKVKEEQGGLKGNIKGCEVLLGSLEYLQAYGVNCDAHLLEIRKLQRTGYEVLCLAQAGNYLGSLTKYRGEVPPELAQCLDSWKAAGIRISLLENSLNLTRAELNELGILEAWTGGNSTIWETSAAWRDQGDEILIVKLLQTAEAEKPGAEAMSRLPCVSVGQIAQVNRSLTYARDMNRVVGEHFRTARRWNYAGAVLAALGIMSAPMANLLTDALTLTLMVRSKQRAEAIQRVSGESLFGKRTKVNSPLSNSPANICTPSISAPMSPHRPECSGTGLSSEGSSHFFLSSSRTWCTRNEREVLQAFAAREEGLEPEEVEFQRKQHGLNQLEPKRPKPWLLSYLSQFTEFTTLIVLGTSALALVTGAVFDGLAMGTILLANAAIGTLQERKAERVIDALNQFQPPSCSVVRGGRELEIVGTELVPGDIVRLEAGDRVPADLRLLHAWNLEANESALTGESLPVTKEPGCLQGDCQLAEQSNMLFMGTDITRGKGSGIVVGTGMRTEIGHLMSLMKEQDKVTTPLHEKVTSISKAFVKGAALAGGLVFVVGLLRGRPLTEMITTSITLAASAVPEGLPVTITIALSAGIYRMAKQNALIRKLSALETLGRTTIICTDKTGTLTKNEMTVTQIVTPRRSWKITGEGYEPAGKVVPLSGTEEAGIDPEFAQMSRIGLLCNNSQLVHEEENWTVKGDPTEGALLTLAAKAGFRSESMKQWQRVHEVPFDSQTGTMSVICRDTAASNNCFVFCKGSVEAVLRRCSYYQEEGVIHPLTEAKRELIYRQNEKLAREALRVLGFAYCPAQGNSPELSGVNVETELIYVGLAGMMDPPKPEVKDSVREAYALGVKPVMITGDHPITARAIAKELGIGGEKARILTGRELDALSDVQLAAVVDEVSIFARVTPEHKLRIVRAYQKAGHIVAMTGDGVNDTPAIKQSNTGIAMGRTGTEVTKATADMVLKKDHFGSILEGVKEGRTIIANMRKAIGCLLTGNLAEILVTATAVIAGLPMPLVPIQILLMNLLTDAIPAMILAVNPGSEKQYTERQDIVDKKLYQKVVTRGILLGAGALGLFGVTLAAGAPLAVAQTVAFTTLVLGQLGQTFSWHQEGSAGGIRESLQDRYLVGSLAASFLALVGAIYIPPAAAFFHTAPLRFTHWIAIFLLAAAVSHLAKPFLALVARRADKIPLTGGSGAAKLAEPVVKGWPGKISPLMAGR